MPELVTQEFTIAFVAPLLIALAITPAVIWFATRIGALDQPNERKVHTAPTPRLGGIAIYISFCISILLTFYFEPRQQVIAALDPHAAVMLVLSLTLVLMLGVWDDLQPLKPGRKFLGQVIAASIVYLAGFRISSITHPFGPETLQLSFLDYPATILWIVGITNAFNLIDGLDGLASGVALIVSLTIFTISYLKGITMSAMMALTIGGAVLGFLPYNFNRARIFLGDSGSLFLGFTLAILSIQSSTKGSTAFSLIVPMLALGLPIMDTLLSMARRLLRSLVHDSGKRESFIQRFVVMFLPDRGHIHHQLIARGFSHRTAVLVLYVVSCVFGLGAFMVTVSNDPTTSGILIAIGIATFIGVSQLRYKEMAVLRNGVLLPLYEWPLMGSSLFQSFLDLAFVVISYTVAYKLTINTGISLRIDHPFIRTLTVLAGIQLSVFSLSGLYKSAYRQFGIADLIKIVKSATIALLISWVVLKVLPKSWSAFNLTLIVLQYYFILTLVTGARVSFHILNFLSRQEKKNGERKVIIYGADMKGNSLLQQIINDDALHLDPVGFLDEDPLLEGKRLNGYPVFGGHWKFSRLAREKKVHELIITDDGIHPEILKRLEKTSQETGVTIRFYRSRLEEMNPSSRPDSQESFAFVKR